MRTGMGGTGSFEGRGMFGVDTKSNKFVHTWADSTDSMIAYSTGDFDRTGNTFNFTAEESKESGATGKSGSGMSGNRSNTSDTSGGGGLSNVMHGKQPRVVLRVMSNDRHVVEYYTSGNDGQENKVMEITYTRSR
jgi:hypothetical protein